MGTAILADHASWTSIGTYKKDIHICRVDNSNAQYSIEAYNRSAQLPLDEEQDHSNRVIYTG